MEKNCITQINIPSIDNESLECDEITSSKCIIVEQECQKIGNISGETMDKFILRLCTKLSTMNNKIGILIQEVERLKGIVDNTNPTQ